MARIGPDRRRRFDDEEVTRQSGGRGGPPSVEQTRSILDPITSRPPSQVFDFQGSPGNTVSTGQNRLQTILDERLGPFLEGRQEALRQQEQALMDRIGQGPVQPRQVDVSKTDLGRIRGELQNVAGAVTEELFAPGGQVEQMTSQALRQTSKSGFGPTSGGFDRARLNILGQAQNTVANKVAQAGAQLAGTAVKENLGLTRADISQAQQSARTRQQGRGQDLQALSGLQGRNLQAATGLTESLFGGQANVEQLRLAEEQQRQNQRILDEFMRRRQQEEGRNVGETAAAGIGGALKGAGTGAAVGSIVPGVGTAIGAGVGALGGLLGGIF